jgi:hypothetical protein
MEFSQVGGEINPLELVGLKIGYQIFFKEIIV